MPHPIHTVEKGRPFYCVWIKMWDDNVSGNCSKHWNKHWNWYLAHAGLPRRLLHQEYFVCFVSTSPHASVLEQASRICEQIRYVMRHTSQITLISLSPRSTEQGSVAFDCEQKEEIMFTIGIFSLPADNPMQSELASHIGLKGNLFCHWCTVGGTQQQKSSEEGFHALLPVLSWSKAQA